jgi:putative ABC transport system permease protein
MPLILLVLTVSLAAFTASLAQTLDFQLSDNAFYRMGADVRLRGPGIDFTPPAAVGMPSEVSGGLFLPMDEYLTFPGVESATRVGRYAAKTVVGGNRVQGAYLGIDRADFAESGFWRDDFADERLGTLQNALAVAPEGLLVSSDFMRQRGLRPGDLFRLTVAVGEGEVELDAQIVGELNYFPTWYGTEDGPLFVGNLETVFALTGGEMPYEVWLDTDGPPDKTAIDTALLERRLLGWNWREPYTHIARELNRPERQGLFGQLSIGFITAALLTVLGFFMYALFSFRQRFVTLGILRAVGMSTGQMVTLIAFELAALILSGLTLGTLFGIWISELFIPYLQVGDRAVDLIPPYLVQIAWPEIYRIYGLFLLLFVVALLVLVLLLRRMKIFQAIKLGETI